MCKPLIINCLKFFFQNVWPCQKNVVTLVIKPNMGRLYSSFNYGRVLVIDWYVNTIITSREMILSLNIVSKDNRQHLRQR